MTLETEAKKLQKEVILPEVDIFHLFGRIKIISTPTGEAPEEIRKAWIGVEMPCVFKQKQSGGSFGILSGKQKKPSDVYIVSQIQAIDILEEKDANAAKWWRDNGYPHSNEALFSFKTEEAEEIKRVLTEEEFEKEATKLLNQN